MGQSITAVCDIYDVEEIEVMNVNNTELKIKPRYECIISYLPVIVKEKNADNVLYSFKRAMYFGVKRFLDIVCSLIGIIALIPVAICTKICYVISGDMTPICYKQKRIGKNGKEIYIYKFRSMVKNADKALEEILKEPKLKEEWNKNQKLENDPRITKVGKILRKTSLDELPQFINVLKGEMSVIGPRPLVEGELDAHFGNHYIYESIRPGITGWWACNGRSATDYEKRLELEYFYCKNCSLVLDIKCIFLTIKAILFKSGAV